MEDEFWKIKIFQSFLFSQHFQSSLNLVISCGVRDACNSIIMYSD